MSLATINRLATQFEPEEAQTFKKFADMKRLDPKLPGGWKILLTSDEIQKYARVIAVIDQEISVGDAILYDRQLIEALGQQ